MKCKSKLNLIAEMYMIFWCDASTDCHVHVKIVHWIHNTLRLFAVVMSIKLIEHHNWRQIPSNVCVVCTVCLLVQFCFVFFFMMIVPWHVFQPLCTIEWTEFNHHSPSPSFYPYFHLFHSSSGNGEGQACVYNRLE